MYNNIESGAAWPNQCLCARSAYLLKPDGDPLDPGGFRVLAILSVIYRLWAAARLQSLQPWVKHWALDGTCAGLPGVGAEDGWYCSSVEMEHAKLLGIPFLGGMVDIWKCFDQILRPLLYCLLSAMGCPLKVITAYISFQEAATYHNSVAGGLGKAHVRRCGIPQGCPLSMMFIAILMTPWMCFMQTLGISARVLADDILLVGYGDKGHKIFAQALDSTHQYLIDVGAKVAPDKSLLFEIGRAHV